MTSGCYLRKVKIYDYFEIYFDAYKYYLYMLNVSFSGEPSVWGTV